MGYRILPVLLCITGTLTAQQVAQPASTQNMADVREIESLKTSSIQVSIKAGKDATGKDILVAENRTKTPPPGLDYVITVSGTARPPLPPPLCVPANVQLSLCPAPNVTSALCLPAGQALVACDLLNTRRAPCDASTPPKPEDGRMTLYKAQADASDPTKVDANALPTLVIENEANVPVQMIHVEIPESTDPIEREKELTAAADKCRMHVREMVGNLLDACSDGDSRTLCQEVRKLYEDCACEKEVHSTRRTIAPGATITIPFPAHAYYDFRDTGTHSTLADVRVNFTAVTTQVVVPPPNPHEDVRPAENALRYLAAVVPLDNTGVANYRYLNPRNPACIGCTGTVADATRIARTVAFVNRTVDRFFVVSIAVDKNVSNTLAEAGAGGCQFDKECTISTQVAPQSVGVFDEDILAAIPITQVMKFEVSFFDETDKPANPAAYLSKAPAATKKDTKGDTVTEPADKIEFHPVGRFATATDPFLLKGTDVTPCGLDHQDGCFDYAGERRHHYTGSARLEVTANLGNRADATLNLTYKDSDLGGKDENRLTANQFQVNIYSLNGIIFQVGKFTFVEAANKLAINEKGDGYRWVAPIPFGERRIYGSIAHVITRESEEGVSNEQNRDNHDWVGQLKGIPLASDDPEARFVLFRTMDLVYLDGEDRSTSTKRRYRTYGGEAFFSRANIGCHDDIAHCAAIGEPGKSFRNWGNIGGSVAWFSSRRSVPGSAEKAEGTIGLITLTWTPLIRRTKGNTAFEAIHAISAFYGRGSKDNPDTTQDEAYVGETASFAPDTIFLSSLPAALDSATRFTIGKSLRNKEYVGLQYTNTAFSPLAWLAVNVFRIAETEIRSRATTVKLHDYRFRSPTFTGTSKTDAARELDLDFTVEAPRGIKVTVGGAYLRPGSGLESVLRHNMWVVTSNVSFKL
jgi:hypothetical protein